MNRREAVKYISLIMGGTMVGSAVILQGCKSGDAITGLFTQSDIDFLDEVADTIIPDTDTPGAKAADIGSFMSYMVEDTYEEMDQGIFKEGIHLLDERSKTSFGSGFLEITREQRFELLTLLNEEQQEYTNNKTPDDPPHYFRMMKELTLLGYFTSEIGVTQARRYNPVPGKYEACIDYTPGDKVWVHS